MFTPTISEVIKCTWGLRKMKMVLLESQNPTGNPRKGKQDAAHLDVFSSSLFLGRVSQSEIRWFIQTG